jgi:hypothetical protein
MSPERHDRASDRRNIIITAEHEHFKEKELRWFDKVRKQESASIAIVNNPIGQRQMLWMTCLTALVQLDNIYQIISIGREMKKSDLNLWKAASCIQRTFRRYNNQKHSDSQSPRKLTVKRQSANTVSNHTTYQTRLLSCKVILHMLRITSMTWKSILLTYVRYCMYNNQPSNA